MSLVSDETGVWLLTIAQGDVSENVGITVPDIVTFSTSPAFSSEFILQDFVQPAIFS